MLEQFTFWSGIIMLGVALAIWWHLRVQLKLVRIQVNGAMEVYQQIRNEFDSRDQARALYTFPQALERARLWHQGKLIGGDPYGVCDALLQELERLQEEKAP